jgi:Ca2+-binding RTX toxin-like protein
LPDAADVALADASGPLTPNVSIGPATTAAAQMPAGVPIIRGTAGNDTIDAGHGGNILVGGAGADHFVFANVVASAQTPPPLTHVADYSFAQGDIFDFSALTSQFHGSGTSDALVVRAVEDSSGSFAMLQVNTANTSMGSKVGSTWVDVAQLDGAHAGDAVNVLIDNHATTHLAQIHVDLLV